jgi:hypothetical protein
MISIRRLVLAGAATPPSCGGCPTIPLVPLPGRDFNEIREMREPPPGTAVAYDAKRRVPTTRPVFLKTFQRVTSAIRYASFTLKSFYC